MTVNHDYDVLVIGSGFGGPVSAPNLNRGRFCPFE